MSHGYFKIAVVSLSICVVLDNSQIFLDAFSYILKIFILIFDIFIPI